MASVEVNMSGRMYRLRNNQKSLVLHIFSRIFCSTGFQVAFPPIHARTLPRVGTDSNGFALKYPKSIPKILRNGG